MIKMLFSAVITTVCLVTACAGSAKNGTETPVATTEKSTSAIELSSSGIVPSLESANPSIEESVTNGSIEAADKENLLLEYAAIKAELDALDIDQDLLEADHRAGKLDQSSFTTQKAELEKQEDTLELKKDQIKINLKTGFPQPTPPKGTAKELLVLLREAEAVESTLDEQERQLEAEYYNSSISRDDFIKKQIQLLLKDEANNQTKNLLVDVLEVMDVDDYDDDDDD